MTPTSSLGVVEDRNTHDLEHPNIPTIPEENEEDLESVVGSHSNSPLFFQEFNPETPFLEEKKDSALISVLPWRGVLRKTNSKVNITE